MKDATERIYLVATRHAIDVRPIAVEFDAGRGPISHKEHSLSISVRNSDLAVQSFGIPHEWLPVGPGFMDTRFSRLVAGLLEETSKEGPACRTFDLSPVTETCVFAGKCRRPVS